MNNKINDELLSLGFEEVYKNAWENRGSSDTKNIMSLKTGMAVFGADEVLLVRVTETDVEITGDDISVMRMMGGGGYPPRLSVPTGAYRVVAEDPALEQMTVKLAGKNLALELTTDAREAEIGVDDETKIVFARVASPNARYSVSIMNTLEQKKEQLLLRGTTAQEAMYLVQKDSRLYGTGVAAEASLHINDIPALLTVIGQLQE